MKDFHPWTSDEHIEAIEACWDHDISSRDKKIQDLRDKMVCIKGLVDLAEKEYLQGDEVGFRNTLRLIKKELTIED